MYAYLKKYRFSTDVIKQFFIYSFGSFFLRIVSMLVVPLTLRKLLPADFGTLALITSFIAIANAIIGLGLRQVLSIEYFHCTDRTEQITLINDILIIYSAVAIPTILLLLCARRFFFQYIFFNTITAYLYTAMLGIIFLSFFIELLYQLMQYNRLASQLTGLQINIALINSTLTVVFLWYFNMGVSGVILAQLAGAIYGFIISLYAYLHYGYSYLIRIKNSLKKTKHYVFYGMPFISSILFSWIMSSGDRWVLGYYTSMYEVGIYSTADLFAQLFNTLILIPWSGSYLPYIMKQYAQHKDNLAQVEQKNYHAMHCAMLLGLAGIIAGCFAVRPLFQIIFPPNYYSSFQYIWILLIGQLFLLGSYFCSSLIQFHKKRYFLACSYVIPALLNIVLNILLVPFFAIYGAAIATCASYFLYFMITLLYNKILTTKLNKKGLGCPT